MPSFGNGRGNPLAIVTIAQRREHVTLCTLAIIKARAYRLLYPWIAWHTLPKKGCNGIKGPLI